MTIEEYIASEQRHCERELEEARKIGNLELFVRKQGALVELEKINFVLSSLEHKCTIDELRNFCESHRNDSGDLDCASCSFHYPDDEEYCEFWNFCPCVWSGGDVARKIKKELGDS